MKLFKKMVDASAYWSVSKRHAVVLPGVKGVFKKIIMKRTSRLPPADITGPRIRCAQRSPPPAPQPSRPRHQPPARRPQAFLHQHKTAADGASASTLPAGRRPSFMDPGNTTGLRPPAAGL